MSVVMMYELRWSYGKGLWYCQSHWQPHYSPGIWTPKWFSWFNKIAWLQKNNHSDIVRVELTLSESEWIHPQLEWKDGPQNWLKNRPLYLTIYLTELNWKSQKSLRPLPCHMTGEPLGPQEDLHYVGCVRLAQQAGYNPRPTLQAS